MVNFKVAYTTEVDDIDFAIEELMGGLESQGGVSEADVALITCYSEFVESGVVKAIADKLPCASLGQTTLSNTSNMSAEPMSLSVMVLSGEGISFTASLSDPIPEEDKEIIKACYEKAATPRPSFVLAYLPLLVNAGGEFIVSVIDEVSDHVPVFGSVTVDNTMDYHDAHVLYNGEAYPDRLALLAVAGDIDFAFARAALPTDKASIGESVVTAAEGNRLVSVGGAPVGDYLTELGLKRDAEGNLLGVNSFPFVIEYNDGTEPVIRCMYGEAPDKSIVIGGNIPVGAKISVGYIDGDAVVKSTEATLRELMAKGPKAIIMCSCVGRYFAQGLEPDREMLAVYKLLDESGIPYVFYYVGGEICPVPGKGEEWANRFHNDTLVVCSIF